MQVPCARRRAMTGWVGAVGLMRGTGALAGQAGPPALQISWSVDGGPVNAALPPGNSNGGGSYLYEGLIVDAGTGLELSYSLTADPGLGLSGNVSVQNDLEEAIDVFVQVIMSMPDADPDDSQLSGLGVVGLTTGVGGGALSALPPYLWQALVDGNVVGPVASLFADPLVVKHSGPATSAVSAFFGNPDPVPGPPINLSIGFRLSFALTSFDVASITSVLTTVPEPTTCAGDLNGDSEVSIEDLGILLTAWGQCPGAPEPCPADLDGDGTVGIADFLDLLVQWGPCP